MSSVPLIRPWSSNSVAPGRIKTICSFFGSAMVGISLQGTVQFAEGGCVIRLFEDGRADHEQVGPRIVTTCDRLLIDPAVDFQQEFRGQSTQFSKLIECDGIEGLSAKAGI